MERRLGPVLNSRVDQSVVLFDSFSVLCAFRYNPRFLEQFYLSEIFVEANGRYTNWLLRSKAILFATARKSVFPFILDVRHQDFVGCVRD